MDQRTVESVARINRVVVSSEDLLLLSKEIHEMPSDQRDWEGRTVCAIKLFNGQRDKVLAVTWRLEALAKVIISESLPRWVKQEAEDGSRMAAEPVFMAAAKEPILFSDEGPFFNSEAFLSCVLEQSEVEGQG